MSLKFFTFALALMFSVMQAKSQAVPSPGDDSRQHLFKAQQFMHEQRPDLAIPELEAVLVSDPGNLDAQANLGVLFYFRGNFVQAAPHLRAALTAKPELWKIEALLGLSELRLKDQNAGRADLESALPHLMGEKVQREVGDALIASYSGSGELDKAVSVVSVLLEANPTDTGLLLTSYRFYSELANNAMITLALAAPHSAELHQAMAQELSRHGNDEAAIANYREAIQINAKLPGLYLELGSLLYNSADAKLQTEAEEQFKLALALNPLDEKAQLMLGEDAARRGDMKAALVADTRAVELQPNDPEACSELAKVLGSMNQPDKARALLSHALEIDSMNETAHYRLSTLDRQQGKLEDAKKELAEYQKYKTMKAKLRAIFSDMRMKMDDKPEDEGGMSK